MCNAQITFVAWNKYPKCLTKLNFISSWYSCQVFPTRLKKVSDRTTFPVSRCTVALHTLQQNLSSLHQKFDNLLKNRIFSPRSIYRDAKKPTNSNIEQPKKYADYILQHNQHFCAQEKRKSKSEKAK